MDTIEDKPYNTNIPSDNKVLNSLKKRNFNEILDQLQKIINKKTFFNQVNNFYKILSYKVNAHEK